MLRPGVFFALKKYQDKIDEDIINKAREICDGSQVSELFGSHVHQ